MKIILDSYPNPVANSPVVFKFHAEDFSGVVKYSYSYGVDYMPCESPLSLEFAPGYHMVGIKASDAMGHTAVKHTGFTVTDVLPPFVPDEPDVEVSEAQQSDLRERLAENAHRSWSGWLQYMLEKCTPIQVSEAAGTAMLIPVWAVERWTRQMNTPYSELSEQEKVSDRHEADVIISVLKGQKPPSRP